MYKRDLYKFPWFCILLGLIALMLTLLYIFLVVISSLFGKAFSTSDSSSLSYQVFFESWLFWLPVAFGAPPCYTMLFVILEEFETPLTAFLERRLKISHNHQRRIKRCLPILLGITSVGLEIFLMVYVYVQYFEVY